MLKDLFAPDVERIFINVDEFGDYREFRFADGAGGFYVKTIKVVWDEDKSHMQAVSTANGIVYADVACFIASKDLPRAPVAGEMLYSPANQPFEILLCTLTPALYELQLQRYMSKPTMFGQ